MQTKRRIFFSLFFKATLLIAQVDQANYQRGAEPEEICNESQNSEKNFQSVEEKEAEENSSPLMMFGFLGGERGQRRPARNPFDYGDIRRNRDYYGHQDRYAADDESEEEKDFTQHVISWRLGSIRTPSEEASSARPLALMYSSRAKYYDEFVPLILEDARAAIEKGLSEKNKPFEVIIKNDVREPYTSGNPWIMELEGTIPEEQEHSPNMNVLLLEHKSGMKFLVLANERAEEGELKAKFQLSSTTVADRRTIFNARAKWKATYVTSLVTHERMYDACIGKAKPDSLKSIVRGSLSTVIDRNNFCLREHIQHLNESQQRAIQSVVAAPLHSTTIIQGPPGTGKTTTVVGLLRALCALDQRSLVCAPSNKAVQVIAERFLKDCPHTPIILVGVENKISDELRPIFLHTWHKDLKKAFSANLGRVESLLNPADLNPQNSQNRAARSIKFNKDQFLKVLQKAKDDMTTVERQLKKYNFAYEGEFISASLQGARVRKSFFDVVNQRLTHLVTATTPFDFNQENAVALFKENFKEQLDKLQRIKNLALQLPVFTTATDDIEKELIAKSKVVFSTLSVTGRKAMRELPSGVIPKILIVDEGGQSVEAETLIAFQHMPEKVVLAGDTKQLPATTMSQLAKEKNYDRSMMARLEQNHQPALMLETQYRMDPQICHWPSNQYYNGRLQTHSTIVPNTDSGITQAKAFYDIASGKEWNNGSTSKANQKEANYVLQIIKKIRETDKTSNIGVITFYGAQVETIQQMLNEPENRDLKKEVTVSTVDGFQGGERDVIIVSCVRANNKNSADARNVIGFLNDERRLNVAITRAKRTLIVLGNAKTLESQESDVKKLIADLRGRNKFFTEQQFNQFLGNEIQSAKAAKKKAKAINQSSAAVPVVAAVEAPAPKTKEKKQAADAVKKGKQKQIVPTAIASKLARINNPEAYYTDDDMQHLGEMLLPANVHYIVPAVAAVPTGLSQALDEFKNNQEKQQAVIAIHNDNHFTGVLVKKSPDNQFSITHFDPLASDENGRALNKIPDSIYRILAEKFPGVSINNTNSKIQTSTVEGSGKKKINSIDNNHCGPFVLYVMSEMAKGNLRPNPNKPKKLQFKDAGSHWSDIATFTKEMSDAFGRYVREYHAGVVSGHLNLDDHTQIAILRNLINPSRAAVKGPLDTMSALETALPTPPPKPPKPPGSKK